MRRLAVAGAVAALALAIGTSAFAGAFIFAGEANGVDLIAHPTGYTGAGGILNVSVCVDPTSPNAAAMVTPARNIVTTWNARVATSPNLRLGAANDVPGSSVDFESVALHELGHCIGLAHVNLASESGLSGSDSDYTKTTDGADDTWNLGIGPDGVRGSADDVRGDDVNLHWYRIATNNPFTLAPVVDASTYARALGSLPAGHTFAVNADRTVGAALGFPDTESVMQQGTYFDEDQRELAADDVATLSLAMSGLDETAGTADDYTVVLGWAGLTTACDVVLDFDDVETGFAVCQVGGQLVAPDHARITTAHMFFNTGFSWYFNSTLKGVPVTTSSTSTSTSSTTTTSTSSTTTSTSSSTVTSSTATSSTLPPATTTTSTPGSSSSSTTSTSSVTTSSSSTTATSATTSTSASTTSSSASTTSTTTASTSTTSTSSSTVTSTSTSTTTTVPVSGCPASPSPDCVRPGTPHAAALLVRDRAGTRRDAMVWKWRGGKIVDSDFGDPTNTESKLCLYAADAGLLSVTDIPTARACGSGSGGCWRTSPGKGFRYRDRAGGAGGVARLLMRATRKGGGRIVFKGRGAQLALPPLPQPLPLTVQLRAGRGRCFQAVFRADGLKRSSASVLRARGD